MLIPDVFGVDVTATADDWYYFLGISTGIKIRYFMRIEFKPSTKGSAPCRERWDDSLLTWHGSHICEKYRFQGSNLYITLQSEFVLQFVKYDMVTVSPN